jgi:hypothetical protein
MDLRHLQPLLPAFADELSKEAGIKEDLKTGTRKVLTAVKDVPKKANETAVKAIIRMGNNPVGNKILLHGPEVLQKLIG